MGEPAPDSVDELLRGVASAPAMSSPIRDSVPASATREPAAPSGIDTSVFDLAPSRLRFVSAETEVAYRAWHREQAVPFTRIGMVASIVNWVAGILAVRIVFPELGPEWTAVVLGVPMPVIVAALVLSYRPRLLRWMVVATAAANMFAGIVAVGGPYWFFIPMFDSVPQFATVATILVGFFGFTIFRLLPKHATLAVFPYFVLNAWLYAGEIAHGRATASGFAIYTVIEFSAFVSGLLACVALDRISRSSYRQERIVEAQRELIDRLQRAEVQRQVAERSRDLSHALVRLAEGPRAPARFAAGDVIEDRYRVVRTIGAGGMGQVHEVERIADRRRLALKVLTGVADPRALARFAREAQLAAELDHPNVVPAIDVGVTGGTLFLVMPLVVGVSLDRARDRYGDAAWARPIVAQIADALVAMHERGILHRDLKPSNLLLDGDRVKVTDFGIANVMASAPGDATPDGDTQLAPAAPLTRTGHFVGTPLYMAPELANGVTAAGMAADIFSLGVIAYELLSKRLPFTAPPVYDRLAGRTVPPPPALATIAPEIENDLATLVDRCFADAPSDRPSAHQIATGFRGSRT